MEKIFLSFLGTTNYTPCNYYMEEDDSRKVSNVKYIQEALIKLCYDDFDQPEFFFFLTQEAKGRNWEDDGQYNFETKKCDLPNEGLHTSLLKAGIPESSIRTVDIPEGFSNDDIWSIFTRIYDNIPQECEVILDITHAFRSLPMLATVLMNYLEALKDVNVRAIYYGAFEKLGLGSEVKKMEPEERNAPIINLISLSHLQKWTAAARAFDKTGNTKDITTLIDKEITPLLQATKGRDKVAVLLRGLKMELENLGKYIYTNRSKEILEADFALKIRAYIQQLNKSVDVIPALKPLLHVIQEKIEKFQPNAPNNWLAGVEWCLEHKLYQQAITQLQEGMITHLCQQLKLNPFMKGNRDLCSDAYFIINNKQEEKDWKEKDSKKKIIINDILSHCFLKFTYKDYAALSERRNDINHAGYRVKPSSPKKIIEQINSTYKNISSLL